VDNITVISSLIRGPSAEEQAMCRTSKFVTGAAIKAARERLGLSLIELAWRAELTPGFLKWIETDHVYGGEARDRVITCLGVTEAESSTLQ
jgi:hypothetical protein